MTETWIHDGPPLRLDLLIAARFGVTRGEARRAIEQGLVWLGGRAMRKPGMLVGAGEALRVEGPVAAADQVVTPEPGLPLEVLHEAEGWIAVNKPAGVAVHPLRGDESGTLLNAVAARYPGVLGVGEAGLRSGVVHRLDVTTSGVLLVATRQQAWERLRSAFAERTVVKRYAALVEGRCMGDRELVMDLRVGRHQPARVVATPADAEPPEDSRRCDLRYRCVEACDAASLVEVDLGTGFLHQIRVMMSAAGHPVVGDALYGSALEAERPMLHAARVEYEGVAVEAPVPEDFRAAADHFGLSVGR